MKRFLLVGLSLLVFGSTMAQKTVSYEGADEVVRLWDNSTAKYSNHETRDEIWRNSKKSSIQRSSSCELYIFKAAAEKNTGVAIAMYPGGGYTNLNLFVSLARWYASQGITAAVVKYRLPNFGHYKATIEDAEGAVRYLRTRTDLGIDPTKVGVGGSSAGGHLSSWVSNSMPDGEKPAFAILLYPWIDLSKSTSLAESMALTHLLGNDYTYQDVLNLSTHTMVTPTTPPTLLLLCYDDPVVLSTSSATYYEELVRHGVKASLHIFAYGGHSIKKNAKECQIAIIDWLKWLKMIE